LAKTVLVILVAIAAGVPLLVRPYDRFFVEGDPTIAYPSVNQTVPAWTLTFLVLGMAILIVGGPPLLRLFRTAVTFDDLSPIQGPFLPTLGLVAAIALTLLFTDAIKVFVGRKRPNFYALTNYKGYRDYLETGNMTYWGLVNVGHEGDLGQCFDTTNLNDAMSSFPSGHASLSFSATSFAAFYLTTLTTLARPPHFRFVATIIGVVLIGIATWIAATRTINYYHNFDDILAGSLIGLFSSLTVFYVLFKEDVFIPRRPRGATVAEDCVDQYILAKD